MGAATSVLVECGQYLVVRSTDIDDVILNTLGALWGYGIYLLLRRLFPGFFRQIPMCKGGILA